jgi:hypothetical protein
MLLVMYRGGMVTFQSAHWESTPMISYGKNTVEVGNRPKN